MEKLIEGYWNHNCKEYNALLPGSILNNRYKIKSELGRGGFSIVYLALDQLLFRYVAIKEFFPENWVIRDNRNSSFMIVREEADCRDKTARCMKSFEREAAIMQKLYNIPYTSRILDYFKENDTEYMVMNLIKGKSLQEYFEDKGNICTVAELLPMMEKVMYAIEKIHEIGFLHRDISPKNLILTEEKDLYLIDFGCATSMDKNSTLWNEEIFAHKGFQAPEYADLEGQGTWTDIYSLCSVMFYLLTGNGIGTPENRMNYDYVPYHLSRCGLSNRAQNAVMNGLTLNPALRTSDVRALRLDICQEFYYETDKWKVQYACKTDIGNRERNQDNFMVDGRIYYDGNIQEQAGEIVCLAEEIHIAAVCDGVGGAVAGELASRAVVQALTHFIESHRESDILPEHLLEELLDQLNEKILALGKKIGKTATTVSVLLWKGNHYYAVNIGDSPLFLLHKKKLLRLSVPHTLAQQKKEKEQEIFLSDFHTLTRYLGKENQAGSQMRSFCRGHIEKGDTFFICSDGVTNSISDKKLSRYLRFDPEKCVFSIWKKLKKDKELDNCSVVILRF